MNDLPFFCFVAVCQNTGAHGVGICPAAAFHHLAGFVALGEVRYFGSFDRKPKVYTNASGAHVVYCGVDLGEWVGGCPNPALSNVSQALSGSVEMVLRHHCIEDRASPCSMGIQRRVVRGEYLGPWVEGSISDAWKAYKTMRRQTLEKANLT